MNLTFNGHTHVAGLQGYTYDLTHEWNNVGQRVGLKHRVVINGVVQVPNDTADADQAAVMKALVDELNAAYSVATGDFTVTFPDGTTAFQLRSADMLYGLRVVRGPSYPEPNGIEWVRRRTFTIELEGEQDLPIEGGDGSSDISFMESFTFEGNGGPRKSMMVPMEGDPIEILTTQRTPFRVVQEGRRARRRGKAIEPPPRWPDKEIGELRRVTPIIPQANAGTQQISEIAWSYTFQSPYPFSR